MERHHACSGSTEISIVKMPIVPNVIYKFNVITIKILFKKILKFKTVLNKAGSIRLVSFKLYYMPN